MFKERASLLTVLLFAMIASPAAYAGTLELNTFTGASTDIDVTAPPVTVLMATIGTSGSKGGDDATQTVVSIGGTIPLNAINQVCVNYGGAQSGCVTNPVSKTNITIILGGNEKGGSPFDYFVQLNANAAGSTIFLTVNSITSATTPVTDNLIPPLPRTTTTRNITGSTAPPIIGSPTHAFRADPTEADLGGTLTDAGSPAVTDCGADWGLATTIYPNPVALGSACAVDTPFTVLASGLPSSDTIYYIAWADNGLRGESAESTFITRPAVTTSDATGVTQTEAVLGGTVALGGGQAVTERGVYLHNAPGATAGTKVPMGSGSGAFFSTITSAVYTLNPGTAYYFVAYAVNVSGETVATDEKPFTTAAGQPSLVTTPTVDAIGLVSGEATLGGELASTGGGTISNCGIAWGASDLTDPYEYANNPSVGACSVGTPFSADATGLTNGTTYYFRSWATNESGTSYSANEGSFVPYTAPTVTTGGYTPPTQTQTTLAGTVTDNGGSPITDCGVEWRTSAGTYGDGNSGRTSYGVCSVNVEYTVNATNLNPGVTYFYRAFADTVLSVETPAGTEQGFTTDIGLPTVTTRLPENLTSTTADLGGNIIANGGAPILEHGVVWNTAGDPENSPLGTELNGPTGGPFPYSYLSGVTYSPTVPEASLIYFQAYATNSVGTAYSAQQSFQFVSGQPKDIVVSRVTGQAIVFSWTPGIGEGTLVVIRETATAEVLPQDGYDYLDLPPFPNPHYPDAPELNDGTGTGNYVVYQGSGTSLWITGLALDTQYTITLYDYTGTAYTLDGPAVLVQWTTDERVHNYDNRAACGTDCHNAHGGFLPRGPQLSDVCTGACHMPGGPAENKIGFTTDTAISAAGHPPPASNPNVDTVDCGSCHELHNPNSYDTTQSTHPVTGTIDYNKAFLRANVDKYAPNAATPANLHGGDTAQENTDIPKVVDVDGETVLVPADTPNRGVEGGDETTARGYCQVCHTYTKYHRSTGTATGQLLADGSTSMAHPAWPLIEGDPRCHDGTLIYDPAEDCGENGIGLQPTLNASFQTHCGDCHQHNNNFIGSGGDVSCIVCHAPGGAGTSGANSRPAITTMFDRLSKHIPGGSAAVTEPDCLVCHDQTGHSTDFIVGLNDLNLITTPYEQLTAGASTTATGEGQAFAGHCLSCHDNARADNLPAYASDDSTQTDESPFTGTDPATFDLRVIDATAWTTEAAHNRLVGGVVLSDGVTSIAAGTEVSCVGNGSNGCHASGHGSENNSLLAAWDGVSDPEAADQAANGTIAAVDFCFNCHDGGISSHNIEADFPPTAGTRTPTPTGDWGDPKSGGYQFPNKQHDVHAADQTSSGAQLDCKDCHDPHEVSAPDPVVVPPGDPNGSSLSTYLTTNQATYFDGSGDVIFTYGSGGDQDSSNPGGAGPTQDDYIQFCLVCHDGDPPTGVVMDTTMLNIGYYYGSADRNLDQHGIGFGGNSNRGTLKPPWTGGDAVTYSAVNCNVCHDSHGSQNIYNLRTSISVGGTQMTIGSQFWDAAKIAETTPGQTFGDSSYVLPTPNGVQEQYGFGAWCTFCHEVNHGSNDGTSCSPGHRHGGGNF